MAAVTDIKADGRYCSRNTSRSRSGQWGVRLRKGLFTKFYK